MVREGSLVKERMLGCTLVMAPRTRPKTRQLAYASTPEADQRVREGIAASEGDDAIELTAPELEEYGETGVLPERVERWLTSRD